MTEPHRYVYSGYIYEGEYGENWDALALIQDKRSRFSGLGQEPLAKEIEWALEEWGNYVTARYFISDEEMTLDQANMALVNRLVGSANANYNDAYSEITGYLWTDEDLIIGGHDLLQELRTHVGRYCVLEIEYSKTAPN